MDMVDQLHLEDDMRAVLEHDRKFLANRNFDALSVDAQRKATHDLSLFWCSDKPSVKRVESRNLVVNDRNVEIRTYTPGVDCDDRYIVWVHGGGWIEGSLDGYDRLMRVLANCAQCAIVGIGYTKAPTAQFPDQLHELRAAIAHIDRHIFPSRPKRGIAGYSAGANLIHSTFCRFSDEIEPGYFQRASYVCGAFSDDFSCESYLKYEGMFGQSEARMHRLLEAYAPGAVNRKDKIAFPTDTRQTVCDTFQILYAEHDLLRDDSLGLATALRSQGKSVELFRYDGVTHIFVQRSMGVAAARQAIARIGGFLGHGKSRIRPGAMA